MEIYCKKCQTYFSQTSNNHLSGKGCKKCAIYKNTLSQKFSHEYFLKLVKEVHGETFDYSKTEYNGLNHKIKIICKKHGSFLQTARKHLYQRRGCPTCKQSKGEREISLILNRKNIKFIPEKIFKDLKYKNHLKCDFFLPFYNTIIEYHGRQHYELDGWNKIKDQLTRIAMLEHRKKLDDIKKKYCEINNINYIEIPYYNFSQIEKIICQQIIYNS